MKKSFLFICIFFLASYVWAGFINEPRAPYEPFTTKRKENKVTGYYDNKILFEIVCDTSERIYSTCMVEK